MKPNEFYSVVLRKKIMITPAKIRSVIKGKRAFKVGKYMAKCKATGKMKEYEAWKVTGMAKKKK